MLRNVQHFPLIDGAAPRYLAASLAASTANVRLLIARPLYTTICIAYVVNSWSLYIYMYTAIYMPKHIGTSNGRQGRS